jgi:hypothetical protein
LDSDFSTLTVLVVGLVRNCEKTLVNDVRRISNALGGVASVQWFVVESDSGDSSIEVLSKLRKEKDFFRYTSLGTLRDKIPERTERLAHCRNTYLQELRTFQQYANVDLVVVADLDGINLKFSRQAFESCFVRSDWDACFANQLGPYYDVWTLRHAIWSPNDCWAHYKFLQTVRHSSSSNIQASVYSRMIRIPPSAPWIEVDSAFGGLAVYRASVLKNVAYRGTTMSGDPQCEHVEVNLELSRERRKLFINPALINASYTEHSLRRFFIFRLLEWIRKGVGQTSEVWSEVFGRRKSRGGVNRSGFSP